MIGPKKPHEPGWHEGLASINRRNVGRDRMMNPFGEAIAHAKAGHMWGGPGGVGKVVGKKAFNRARPTADRNDKQPKPPVRRSTRKEPI